LDKRIKLPMWTATLDYIEVGIKSQAKLKIGDCVQNADKKTLPRIS